MTTFRDHNGECNGCDEPVGSHAIDCPLVDALAGRLRAAIAALDQRGDTRLATVLRDALVALDREP
jgi:hypothetical protein